jgi:hypothetical protein
MDPDRQCREDNPRFGDRSTNPFFAPWCERPPPRAVFRCTRDEGPLHRCFHRSFSGHGLAGAAEQTEKTIATREKV